MKANQLKKYLEYFLYRYRFLINYIIIGFSSILLEVLIISILDYFFLKNILIFSFIGFIFGVLFSFSLNAKLNFHVPKERAVRTFKIFVLISFFSYLLNLSILKYLTSALIELDYIYLRFITAGFLFVIGYLLHRKFTFTDVKYVGLAIYLSKDENIDKLWEKVKDYPDYIHIDLVDKSYNENAKEISIDKGYEIKKKWVGILTMTHIMSKKPIAWIEKVANFSDIIFFHLNIDEKPNAVINKINKLKRKPGICLFYNEDVSTLLPYIDKLEYVQILGISKPGESGQYLQKESFKLLNELIILQKKYTFEICFDGGVKRENIERINAKYIVSASGILNSENPVLSIYDLKSNSRYYSKSNSLKKFLNKNILDVAKNIEFIVSANIVGSFVDKEDLSGISDIDIIIIVDKLNKEKFEEIILKYEKLKEIVETDYNMKGYINSTFGPLKFNKKYDFVFHLMIYDVESHLIHCIKSPFTCLDWDRTQTYVKKHLSEVVKTLIPIPMQVIGSRRSIESYTKDLENSELTFRKYNFEKKGEYSEVVEKRKMTSNDKLEYTYHIMKFIMLNTMKVHDKKNYKSEDKIWNEFFNLTKIDKKYLNFFKEITKQKLSEEGKFSNKDLQTLELFLFDVKNFYENYYLKNSKKIIFIRHQKTIFESEKFLGQRNNPSVIEIDNNELDLFTKEFKDISFIMTSDLKRAIETGQYLNLNLDKEMIINKNLREIDYGLLDGKNYTEINNYPELIKGWTQGKDMKFPQGENYADVIKRFELFKEDLFKKEFNKVLIISHNVFIRVIIGQLMQIPQNLWHKIPIAYLERVELIVTEKSNLYLNISQEKIEQIYRCVYGI